MKAESTIDVLSVILDKKVLAVELAQQEIIREDNERNIRFDYNNAGCAKPFYPVYLQKSLLLCLLLKPYHNHLLTYSWSC
jgi:hypothetical protein